MHSGAPAGTPTRPFDIANDIRTPEGAAAYLTEVLADGDEVEFLRALGRESLYKALSEAGNPGLSTVLGVLRALDLRMTVAVTRPEPEAS